MKKFTELLKVLLIVGALTTFAFSAAATDVIVFCEVSEEICATYSETQFFGDIEFIEIIVLEGTHIGHVILGL